MMQIQHQTYPADHCIYVNSPDAAMADYTTVDYSILLSDITPGAGRRIKISYGPSSTVNHKNYTSAITLAHIDDYDLFLKIDDDDIYLRDYISGVVEDFELRRWDYSGTMSMGILNGYRWKPKTIISSLGLGQRDIELGVPGVMPPSCAFSRKAIRAILDLQEVSGYSDIRWRRHLAAAPGMALATRQDKNFIYNVHGGNMSTALWLET